MSDNIHRGIQLDDSFDRAETRLQKALQALETLHDDFREHQHTPVSTQIHRLEHAKSRLEQAIRSFFALKKS